MEIGDVKANLGKRVRLRNVRHSCDGEYILTGCVIRRSERGAFFYQAELQDTEQPHSVSITSLDDIELLKEDQP